MIKHLNYRYYELATEITANNDLHIFHINYSNSINLKYFKIITMISTIRRIIFDKNLIQNVFKKHDIKKQKIIIDFSSPNIAKTLHMGNLRYLLVKFFL